MSTPRARSNPLLQLGLCALIALTWTGCERCSGGAAPLPDGPVKRARPARGVLGSNLLRFKDWSPQYVTVNAFKQSRAWFSSGADGQPDRRPLALDERGWVKSLSPGQQARSLMFWAEGRVKYPAGRYIVTHEGTGELDYFGAGKRVEHAPGRDLVEVAPGGPGFGLALVRTEPADPVRNIVVRHASAPEGELFHPDFLASLPSAYRALRFMDWMATNGSSQVRWANRPKLEDARWTDHGVPVELMVRLANRLKVDPWFCMPHQADDDYVRQFAEQVARTLDPSLHVYVEFSNEVWNGGFAQARFAQQQAARDVARFGNEQGAARWYASRAVRVFRIWRQAFVRDGGRVIRVLAGRASRPQWLASMLSFEDTAKQVDALAIAPYLDADMADTTGVEPILSRLESEGVPRVASRVREHYALAKKHGLELVAYEGGQHLLAPRDARELNQRLTAANRHARMRDVYLAYLKAYKDAGGGLFMHFGHLGQYALDGRWGAFERYGQPRSEAPKFDALLQYAERYDSL